MMQKIAWNQQWFLDFDFFKYFYLECLVGQGGESKEINNGRFSLKESWKVKKHTYMGFDLQIFLQFNFIDF
jgi:hypothetical protein